jgi:predicted extracellular nuclease
MKQLTSRKASLQALPALLFLAIILFPLTVVAPSRAAPQSQDMVITGVIDGPLSGGVPKAIELYVINDIADLSDYGVGSANNGGGSDGQEFTFPAVSATAGDFIYVASETDGFTTFFGFAPSYTSYAASINGDDAIELFQNGAVVDVFGDINVDGTGQAWEYTDGWAYRNDGTGPDGATFVLANWYFSGPNALDGETSNATATTPFPIGSFSTGGDAAPHVSTTNPTDGATGVAVNADVTITFSEAVDVSGEWFQIDCASSGLRHVADTAVSGGPTTFTIDPNSDFAAAETCTATVFATQVTDQDSDDPPDAMNGDYSWNFSTVGYVPPCSTIPLIQGTGAASTCQQYVTGIEGCITGFTANGFYYQDVAGDSDPASSDGLFVYRGYGCNGCSSLAVGNIVSVDGDIIEYYDMTEFAYYNPSNNVYTVIDSGADCDGAGLPAPVAIAPIADPNADPMSLYEQYEGMRVQMSFDGFVVGPTKRFVSDHVAGDPEIAFVDQSSSIYGQRVFEDDYPGYRGMNYISGAFNKDLPDVDFGDSIAATDLVGVLSYQFSKYTLLLDGQLTQNISVTDDTDSEDAETVAGAEEFTLCTFNIENMFDIIDDGDGDMGDWVPADTTEYDRMLEKRAKAIADNLANCTVIGVQEVEGKDPVWDDLVAAISTEGGASYDYDYYESIDPRDITVGILYDPSRVTLNASSQEQGCSATDYGVNYGNADNTYGRVVPDPCTAGAYPLFNRPPYLAQLTLKNADASRTLDVSVIVNHFKSKRGDESENLPRREDQAQHVVNIMQAEYDAGRVSVTALGDFNDVLSSTTLAQFDTSIGGNPLVNLYLAHVPAADRYSYIFSGESEVLDHFITTAEQDDYLITGRAVHINADYPDVDNMGTDNCTDCVFGAGLTAPQDATSHRSSDHDPVLTRYSLCRILNAPASLAIALNSGFSGVDLSWDAVAQSDHYQVWENAAPYFVPDPQSDTPLAEPEAPAYTHANSTGDPATNHYYVVTAVNPCQASSAISSRVGEFDFGLIAGSAGP